MQEKSPNNAVRAAAQARRYTENELALLDRFATRRYTNAELVETFPDRPLTGVKNKIAQVRKGCGQSTHEAAPNTGVAVMMLDPDDPGFEDSWYRNQCKSMAFCNSQFVAALQRYAA